MKKWLLLLFSFIQIELFAQFSCGTPDISPQQEVEYQQLIRRIAQDRQINREGILTTTYLALRPHFICRNDGSTDADLNKFNNGLAAVNRYFAPMGVQWYISGTSPNYINYTAAYDWTLTDRDVMTNTNNVLNAHNLYMSGSLGGIAGFSFGSTQDRVNNRTFLLYGYEQSIAFPHELGHYMNLAHPHNNNSSTVVSDRELVTRNFSEVTPRLSANCDSKGDFICDTPADPANLTGATSSNCVYTGSITDTNNDLFSPLLNNIMTGYYCYPAAFTAGQYTRMTAALAVNNTPSSDASVAYTLDAPETAQTPPSNVVATPLSLAVSLGNTVTWTDNSAVESGFFIERSTTSSTSGFEIISGVAPNVTSYTDLTTNRNTTYYYRIKPSNTKTTYSTASTALTTPQYCAGKVTNTCPNNGEAQHIIDRFMIQTTSNQILLDNANSGCSANSFGNFTSLSANVMAGKTYNFLEKTNYVGGYFPQNVSIFADFNHDGDFDDTGETLYQSQSDIMNGTTTVESSFVIPSTALLGTTRLRVRTRYQSSGIIADACTEYSNGETEDYTLNIASVLPVELLDFAAKNMENQYVNLDWATASEQNASYFLIQRSTEPSAKYFTTIGKVRAQSDSGNMPTTPQYKYHFLDETPASGINYYRLSMVDRDGSSEFSKVETVIFKNGKTVFSVFPNPSDGSEIQIAASESLKNAPSMRLIRTDGTTVLFEKKAVNERAWQLKFKDALPTGLYFLMVEMPESSLPIVHKIVVY